MGQENRRQGTADRPTPLPLEECALARAIATIGDGWSLLILREAIYGVTRFGQIQDDLGIPRSVLSDRLNKLVAAGLFRRVPYREAGQRARQAYELTEKGRDLIPALIALRDWAEGHLLNDPSRLRLRHRDCGAEVHPRLRCDLGHPVESWEEIERVIAKRA